MAAPGANAGAHYERLRLKVAGTEVVVLIAGSGPPLVFFHGAGTFHGFDFALPWSKRFKVYAPYHPGFGESADDHEIDSIHDYVLHYAELFDQLKNHWSAAYSWMRTARNWKFGGLSHLFAFPSPAYVNLPLTCIRMMSRYPSLQVSRASLPTTSQVLGLSRAWSRNAVKSSLTVR